MSSSKILSILLYVLMGISIVLVLIFFVGGKVEGTEGTPMEEPLITNFILNWTIVLLIGAAIAALIFPLIQIFTNPQNIKKTIIGLVAVGLIVGISYAFASDEVLHLIDYDGPDNVPRTLKLSDTGIFTAYGLAAIAIIAMLYTEIAKYFK